MRLIEWIGGEIMEYRSKNLNKLPPEAREEYRALRDDYNPFKCDLNLYWLKDKQYMGELNFEVKGRGDRTHREEYDTGHYEFETSKWNKRLSYFVRWLFGLS